MWVGHLIDFLVFHDLRLLCVILVDVITSSHHLFFPSSILSISLFPGYGAASKGLLK